MRIIVEDASSPRGFVVYSIPKEYTTAIPDDKKENNYDIKKFHGNKRYIVKPDWTGEQVVLSANFDTKQITLGPDPGPTQAEIDQELDREVDEVVLKDTRFKALAKTLLLEINTVRAELRKLGATNMQPITPKQFRNKLRNNMK